MVWVIAFGELFFGDLWCVVWGYGGMRTHFSLLNPQLQECASFLGLSGLSNLVLLGIEAELIVRGGFCWCIGAIGRGRGCVG